MREPKFSDAPCYGNEFDADSRVCRVCLGGKSCARKYYQAFAGRKRRVAALVGPARPRGWRISRPLAPEPIWTTASA